MEKGNSERILKELYGFVKEQKEINRDQKRMNHVLEQSARYLGKLVEDHELWMRNHEVRLTT